MKIIRFLLFCGLGLALVFANVYTVLAKAPTTARIVFFSLRDDNAEIYTMAPDGSQQRNLTKHPSMDREPVWSPTGEHILFASDRTGILDLYLMDPNGTNVRKVFRVSAHRKHPSWSPDGKKIAYVKRQAIYIATIDGETEEQIVKVGDRGGSPAWSPDGTELARKEPDGYQLVLVRPNAHGKQVRGVQSIMVSRWKQNRLFLVERGRGKKYPLQYKSRWKREAGDSCTGTQITQTCLVSIRRRAALSNLPLQNLAFQGGDVVAVPWVVSRKKLDKRFKMWYLRVSSWQHNQRPLVAFCLPTD